ncbi:uncharacterized protein LOC144627168 [Crassostrea virginica]
MPCWHVGLVSHAVMWGASYLQFNAAIKGKHVETSTPSTSQLCQWKLPRQLNLPATPLAEMNLRKPVSTAGLLQPITVELSRFVELSTRSQRNSPEWVSLHKGPLSYH